MATSWEEEHQSLTLSPSLFWFWFKLWVRNFKEPTFWKRKAIGFARWGFLPALCLVAGLCAFADGAGKIFIALSPWSALSKDSSIPLSTPTLHTIKGDRLLAKVGAQRSLFEHLPSCQDWSKGGWWQKQEKQLLHWVCLVSVPRVTIQKIAFIPCPHWRKCKKDQDHVKRKFLPHKNHRERKLLSDSNNPNDKFQVWRKDPSLRFPEIQSKNPSMIS